VAVVVSTHGRSGYLSGMLACLELLSHPGFEVLVVDNGSSDDTWAVLSAWVAATPLPAVALRVAYCDSPAVPRNTAVSQVTAPLLAFTDDDCLPAEGWLTALTDALSEGVSVVQGRTLPEVGGWGGPWGRSLTVTGTTGLYETANLACRTADFAAVGGFPAKRLLTGRPFGEGAARELPGVPARAEPARGLSPAA
jgi:glycosyltransferase involved in cell wall biosynthesis